MSQPITKRLTKQIQDKFNYYFRKIGMHLSKPETRCVREMSLGIIKGQRMTVNKIATFIEGKVSLKKIGKRFRHHYSKPGFWKKLLSAHLSSISPRVKEGDYMIVDLSDVQKRYARCMEGLEWVRDGDKDKTGLGYWLMNIISVSRDGMDIVPLYMKLYSFVKGTFSENQEIIEGINTVSRYIDKPVTWVIDRGGDRPAILDRLFDSLSSFVVRLTKRRRLYYQGEWLAVGELSRCVDLSLKKTVKKIRKHREQTEHYKLGAVRVEYENREGQRISAWLVVSKRRGGGYSWFLFHTSRKDKQEVMEECFRAYGYRWKIEEYHRHIKSEYRIEEVQVRSLPALRSLLAVVTVSMYLIYRELSSLHDKLILESGIKTMIQHDIRELTGFIYYKIGLIVKRLLAYVRVRWFTSKQQKPPDPQGQLTLEHFLT